MLKVKCPHCGEVHEISVRETYINGALSGASRRLHGVV
jgi:phage FluMu protein Com